MAPSTSIVGRLGCILLAATAILKPALGLEQKYCSPKNTAEGLGTPSIYQTTGLCYDQCVKTHAFAVVYENLCWCSNYIPGETVDRKECNAPCKGYDKENCGGPDLYGYIKLNLQASGTKGAPASTSKKEDEPKTEEPKTVTAPGATVTVTPIPPSSASPSSTSSTDPGTSSISSPSKTSTSTPSTTSPPSTTTSADSESTEPAYASTVTESGEERIITVIPTPVAPVETNKKSADEGSGGGGKLGTGAAVGLTIGLVALACIVGGILFLFLRKKRKDGDAERLRSNSFSPAAPGSGIPSRTMSENSRYMLGTDGRSEVVGGWQQDGVMNQAGNRRSRLMPVDPRLDPFAVVYQRGDGAHSRESVMSVRDDMDYSRRVVGGPVIAGSAPKRVLGVANP